MLNLVKNESLKLRWGGGHVAEIIKDRSVLRSLVDKPILSSPLGRPILDVS